MAAITGALAEEPINIRAIVQKPGYPQYALQLVVTVEPCRTSALKLEYRDQGSGVRTFLNLRGETL